MDSIKIFTIASLFLLFGCFQDQEKTDREKQTEEDEQVISQYLADNNIDALRGDDGLFYEILQENPDGRQVQIDDIVGVYYRITHLNGQLIESKIAANTDQPLKFQHRKDALFPVGINIGVGYMREGETFRFYLPSTLAFEDFNVPNFLNANAILVAEVEVAEITSEIQQHELEKDSIQSFLASQNITEFIELPNGLVKYTLEPGTGTSNPVTGQRLNLNITRGYLDGTLTRVPTDVDENNNAELVMGKDMTPGLQMGLEMMVQGERAVILVPSYLAFGSSIQVFPQEFRQDFVRKHLNTQDIYPFAIIRYEIELLQMPF